MERGALPGDYAGQEPPHPIGAQPLSRSEQTEQ
jgi:hypothetical protein